MEALADDKAAAYEARVQAESRLHALQAELESACGELEQERHRGTPKGEAAQAGWQAGRQGYPRQRLLTWPLVTAARVPWSPCPAGEAAKEVNRLAFQRIKELQEAVADARLTAAAKDERIGALEAEAGAAGESAKAAQVGLSVAWRGRLRQAFASLSA